jgi:putative glutathione S-transferase
MLTTWGKPIAHRVLIVRKLKGLENIIGFTSVHWHMAEKGKPHSSSPAQSPIVLI